MADTPNNPAAGLLPAGLSDLMPVDAKREAETVSSLMETFHLFGYNPVEPPLVEFEDTLLADGPGAALAADTFRLMDPQSSRMMALRADMTAQIARIASTRMGHWPRPLRLSYKGAVLRVKPDPLNPERQLTQVGAEMIGADSPQHDAELALAALTALSATGVAALTIDLGVPRLLESLYADADLPAALVEAVRAKDHALIQAHGGDKADLLAQLLDIPLAGRDGLDVAISQISADMPAAARAMLAELVEVSGYIAAAMPSVTVTVDPLEQRGFDYHHGIGFAIFSPGIRGELGRGGRYRTAAARMDQENQAGESSTGVTLYLERVLRALPMPQAQDRLYIPASDGLAALVASIAEGRASVLGSAGKTTPEDRQAEAIALGCSHWLNNGRVAPLGQ